MLARFVRSKKFGGAIRRGEEEKRTRRRYLLILKTKLKVERRESIKTIKNKANKIAKKIRARRPLVDQFARLRARHREIIGKFRFTINDYDYELTRTRGN